MPDNRHRILGYLLRSGILALTVFSLLYPMSIIAQENEDIFNKRITLPSQRTTIYNALNQISDSIGFYFAYSSHEISSDKAIHPKVKNKSLREALFHILGDTLYQFRIIDKHILIFREKLQSKETNQQGLAENKERLNIKGRVLDSKTKQPIIYATIGIPLLGIGTITNQEGSFLLKLPSALVNKNVTISHIGYETKEVSLKLLAMQPIDIFLETNYISIQEVIIRNIEPQLLVKEAVAKIPDNFNPDPVYLTTFYREGVIMNNKYQNYSEAVFNIYKSSYSKPNETDQVKLLKSRKINNLDQSDTLNIKLRGGVNSALMLDIAKNLPDFFEEENAQYFNYTRKDIVTIGNKTAYVIAFAQKEHVIEPLLKGDIYIDVETLAIIGADFEINPKYISLVTDRYLLKRNRKFIIRPERISYSVRFTEINGKYNLNHVRGDLHFKYRKRRSLFYNPFHAFLELITTEIDNQNVKRFDRRETERTKEIFTDLNHEYDDQFWMDFNFIEPEQSIFDTLSQIKQKIEQISSHK